MMRIGWKVCGVVLLFLGSVHHGVDGSCSVTHCTDDARCLLSADRTRCKCTGGYFGDQCNRSADIKVMCGLDYITVRALEDFFAYHGVPLEALHLPNASCRAQREVIDGVPYYMSRISKEKYLMCGGKPLQKNLTHVSYSLSLQSERRVSGNIIRDPIINMDFKCLYPYVRSVSLPFPLVPLSSETVMHVHELDATVQMMLYTNHTYKEAYTKAPSIELRDEVFVEVSVTEPADYFLLQVSECWATQSPQPDTMEASTHTLLQNGCVRDPTVSFIGADGGEGGGGGGRSGRNGEGATVRYSFQMFRFTAEPHDLYLHCTVQLCERDDAQSCDPNCNSMSKREALKADPGQGLLSYGPIRIEMPSKPKSSILATVVLPVVAVWTVGFFLLALITVAKADRRRLTRVDGH